MAGILTAGTATFTVTHAVLRVHVSSHPALQTPEGCAYTLELVDLDQDGVEPGEEGHLGLPGEDGAPAPCCESVPVFPMMGNRHPHPDELVGQTFDLSDDEWDWDAWFGNDAPPLEENRVTIHERTPDGFRISWTADGGSPEYGIRYEGDVVFEVMHWSADPEATAIATVATCWNAAALTGMRLTKIDPSSPGSNAGYVWTLA